MTNKNRVSAARGGPWTSRFEDLARKAGMGLEDAANKVRIPGHYGPHPQEYHEVVFDVLEANLGAGFDLVDVGPYKGDGGVVVHGRIVTAEAEATPRFLQGLFG
jgi:hypothetical protein